MVIDRTKEWPPKMHQAQINKRNVPYCYHVPDTLAEAIYLYGRETTLHLVHAALRQAANRYVAKYLSEGMREDEIRARLLYYSPLRSLWIRQPGAWEKWLRMTVEERLEVMRDAELYVEYSDKGYDVDEPVKGELTNPQCPRYSLSTDLTTTIQQLQSLEKQYS